MANREPKGMRSGKLVIAVGGGPTAVINQSLAGAVLEARLFPQIERIYGARYGVRGIVNEDFVDLSAESRANLEAIAATPSSALGSTRDKPDLAYCRNILASLKAHGASWFLYIGGNDTADTVRIVSEEAAKEGYDLRSIHIPKTIDNDLMENDHTPGFPSAARFVAQAFMGADLDNRSLPGVYVAVVMGRHAGFLTAASAAARTVEGDGPHLIYLPERIFDEAKFLSEVKSVHDRLGRCVIAMSEGIHDIDGTPLSVKLAQTVEKDAHGNVQLSGTGALADRLCEEIKSKLGIKRVRGDTFGYLQRSFAGCASDVDRREAREVGEFAVKQAIWGTDDGSVAIQRIGDYSFDYALVKLAKVGGKTKVMPDAFIAPSGSDVTPAFQAYLRPLLGSDLPQPARLRGGTIAKVLKR
jgi:ATP-dependent phosphofructokinase / diphosphate-dependent phosphofructokinase